MEGFSGTHAERGQRTNKRRNSVSAKRGIMNKETEHYQAGPGEALAIDIVRLDLMEIMELERLSDVKRRLTSLAMTANEQLTDETLRMLADVHRA